MPETVKRCPPETPDIRKVTHDVQSMQDLPTPVNAEISSIAHATEDPDKVARAVKNTLPPELQTKVALRRNHMTGHHKNPIIRLGARLSDREAVGKLLESIGAGLMPLDRSALASEFRSFVDGKGVLYIRLDKQAAYFGNFRLRQDDPIRIKVKFIGRGSSVQTIREYCGKVGLIE